MPQMTGGEALAKSLYREGVRVIFGLPGIQLYGLMAALRDEPGIRFIVTRHEQGAAYMADGYARAGGEFGTALVVPGPGLYNASAALSTAYSASSPVLMVSGQIPKDSIGKDVGQLHEVNDQLEAIKPVTKWQRRVLEVSDIPAAVHEAVYQLKTGRPRPVEIEFPLDTLEGLGEAELLEASNPVRPVAAAADIDRAAEMLLAAKRPVIIAGGGVVGGDAGEGLAAVAEHLQAGVITSMSGKGAMDDRSYLSLGCPGFPSGPLLEHIQAADIVLAVGTRFVWSGVRDDQQVIQLDIDPEEIGRNHGKTFGLEGDGGRTLAALLERLQSDGDARASRREELEELRRGLSARAQETQPQGGMVAALRDACPEDTILISGLTQVAYYSIPHWPVYGPRTYLTSGYQGTLGFAYPTGLGAKVACPDTPVVVLSGDGGFLYSVQEMATAVQHGINAVVVVFNDGAYGNVSRDLDDDWGGTYGAELHNPDFAALAESFGLTGIKVDDHAALGPSVADAIQMDRPVLVEVPVDRMPRPTFFPRRPPPGETIPL